MSYDPHRVGYASPDEATVPLRRGGSPPGYYLMPSPLPYTPTSATSSVYGLENSPSIRKVELETNPSSQGGRRPFRLGAQAKHQHSLEESWDQAVQVGRWPRIIYAVVGVLFVIVWMVVTYVFDRSELKYQTKNMGEQRQSIATSAAHGGVLWTLQGALKQFDPISRTLTVNWSPMLIDNGTISSFGASLDSTLEIGIFRDQALIADTPAHLAQINSTHPELSVFSGFSIDNDTAIPIAVVGRHEWDDFTTDIDLGQMLTGHAWTTPAFGYPLEKWSGNIVFVGNYRYPAQLANLPTSFGVSIDGAYLVDSIMNWRISATTNNTCADLSPDAQSCQLQIKFTVKRPSLVTTATIIAVIVNWLSTIFIFIMTCEGVILRRTKMIESSSLLGICFTALFALPSVRSILPGAPEEFGCLNLVGIIPNVIIVSLCTTMVSISTLRTMADNNKTHKTMMKHNRTL